MTPPPLKPTLLAEVKAAAIAYTRRFVEESIDRYAQGLAFEIVQVVSVRLGFPAVRPARSEQILRADSESGEDNGG